jgi:pimeloyl-ACP methyl ester carboxylesterase
MNAQVRWLLTLDSQDPDEHDQPFRIHERLPSGAMPFEQWELSGMEKFEKIPTRLAHPFARKLTGGAGCSHGALLSAKNSPILPQLALLIKCRDPSINFLSSIDTAEDIERIRQALSPNDGLVAHGASYGTAYGAAYLERYGDQVQALVLDAVLDHSIDLSTELATRQLPAIQDAFDRMAQWCGEDSSCALHGEDVGSAFDTAVAAEPAVRPLVPQFLAAGRDGWLLITRMLAEVVAGDTSTLDELIRLTSLAGQDQDPQVRAGRDGMFRAVTCGDYGPQDDYAALLETGKAAALAAPRFAWRFWDATPVAHGTVGIGICVGWPLEARNPPHRLQVGAHPNVMVANPTHDPATAVGNALALWLQIPEAPLLLADVDGHEALALSQCAFEAEFRFLNDPTSVATTTLCPD